MSPSERKPAGGARAAAHRNQAPGSGSVCGPAHTAGGFGRRPASALTEASQDDSPRCKQGREPPCGLEILTIRSSYTRLETRTKESNICASVRVANPRRGMKVNEVGRRKAAPSTDHDFQ